MDYGKSIQDLKEEEEAAEPELNKNAMRLLSQYPEAKSVITNPDSPLYTRQ